MCGIVGVITKDNLNIKENELNAFRDSLAHRGPDGSGSFIDGTVGLGHRRLAILDTTDAGKQPMQSAEGRYHITYNGEIFNFLELRTELERLGYSFKTSTDTEVILAAYQEWGKACLDKFNGMWAFAIYDSEDGSVFLARDRFGIKPLYFVNTEALFAFASETIAFDSLAGFDKEINNAMLSANLKNIFLLESRGLTTYKHMYSLRPGHYMQVTEQMVGKQIRWYHFEKREVPELYEEQVAEFRELFMDACRIRMRSDVQIGTALSGGMDSSSVYAMVQQVMKHGDAERTPDNWQQAYSAQFEGSSLNEKEFAHSVADFVGGEITDISITPDDVIGDIEYDTKHFDCIHVSPLTVLSSIYKRMRESGVVVSLDGHGVDEMMFGYPDLIAEAYRIAKAKGNTVYASDLLDIYKGMYDPLDAATVAKDLEDSATTRKLFVKKIKRAVPQFVKNLLSKDSWLQKSRVVLPRIGIDIDIDIELERECAPLKENFFESVLPTLLRNFDRASMKHGVEIRMPFMDYRIVEFIFSLPATSLAGGGYAKRILRDAMKDMLPKYIIQRTRKIGINAPLHEWFGNELKSFVYDTVTSTEFSDSDIWNSEEIKAFVKAHDSCTVWPWNDAIKVWPYINAHILTK